MKSIYKLFPLLLILALLSISVSADNEQFDDVNYNNYTLYNVSNITAIRFIGDGSQLTGITGANGSNILQDNAYNHTQFHENDNQLNVNLSWFQTAVNALVDLSNYVTLSLLSTNNASLITYIDAQDVTFNNSAIADVDAKLGSYVNDSQFVDNNETLKNYTDGLNGTWEDKIYTGQSGIIANTDGNFTINTSYVNDSVGTNASIDARVTQSFLQAILDAVYVTISVFETNNASVKDYVDGLNGTWEDKVYTGHSGIIANADGNFSVNTTYINDSIGTNATIDARVTQSFLQNLLDTVYVSLSNIYISEVQNDTTPQLGGNLDTNEFNLTGNHSLIFDTGGQRTSNGSCEVLWILNSGNTVCFN